MPSPFAQLAALLSRAHLNPFVPTRGVPRRTLDEVLAIFDEATAAKEGDAAAPSSEADGRRHHALAVLVVEVADDAALLKTKLTQAQIDELGQRLAEADVAFGIVKSAAGGVLSGGGGRNANFGNVNFGNRAAAAVWLGRGKGNKSHALAACRAELSTKQVGSQLVSALGDVRIKQHEATVEAARAYLRTNPAPRRARSFRCQAGSFKASQTPRQC